MTASTVVGPEHTPVSGDGAGGMSLRDALAEALAALGIFVSITCRVVAARFRT